MKAIKTTGKLLLIALAFAFIGSVAWPIFFPIFLGVSLIWALWADERIYRINTAKIEKEFDEAVQQLNELNYEKKRENKYTAEWIDNIWPS